MLVERYIWLHGYFTNNELRQKPISPYNTFFKSLWMTIISLHNVNLSAV